MNCPLQARNLYRNGEKKFNSIFINQLIHFFFSTPLSAHIECSLFSFDAVEKKILAIPQSRQFGITLNWKQSSIIVQNVLHFTLIYFCSLLCVCFIHFYFHFFAGCNHIVTTKICERSVKYELAFGTGHQMMKPDTQILQWPVNFEWVKNSCTLERVYKHNKAERSVAVHWIQSTKVVAQTDCTI